MSAKSRSTVLVLVLLVSFSVRAAAEEFKAITDISQLGDLGDAERVTAYVHEDRTEYYADEMLSKIDRQWRFPVATEAGVLFTEIFLVKFHRHPEIYLAKRGWDKDGNCHVFSAPLRVNGNFSGSSVALDDDYELPGGGNTCSGDPCSKCKAYDPDRGCRCEIGERCNHSVTTN